MKKILCILFCSLFLFTGCAHDLTVNGTTYKSYGLFNASSEQNPNIEYSVSVGNLVWSIILFETVVMPIYFFGFSIMNPVRFKNTKCQIVNSTN